MILNSKHTIYYSISVDNVVFLFIVFLSACLLFVCYKKKAPTGINR